MHSLPPRIGIVCAYTRMQFMVSALRATADRRRFYLPRVSGCQYCTHCRTNCLNTCNACKLKLTHATTTLNQNVSCDDCNKSLVLATSCSEKNPGRLYLKCPKRTCKFFQWIDEPPRGLAEEILIKRVIIKELF